MKPSPPYAPVGPAPPTSPCWWVAADDGVMPQTLEAINHAKAAEVPIIAAINKVDRPDADPERVKRQMAEHNMLVEEWGGDIITVPVSATTGEGIQDLVESLLLVAEVADLKANPHKAARGVIIEAKLDRHRGPLATVLVQSGTPERGRLYRGRHCPRPRSGLGRRHRPAPDVSPARPAGRGDGFRFAARRRRPLRRGEQ